METSKLQYTPKRKTEMWGYTDNNFVKFKDKELNCFESFIWERCNGRYTVSDAIKSWEKIYNTTEITENIEARVLDLLEKWKSEDLLILNFNFLHSASEYDDSCIYHLEAHVKPPVDILLLTAPTPCPASHKINEKNPLLDPLGIGYISAYLRSKGFNVGIMDLWDKQVNPVTINDIVERYSPKIVGISSVTDTFENGIRIADIVKRFCHEITIIFGGPHVTFEDKTTLLQHKSIDVVVRGEGEHSFLELAKLFIHNIGELAKIDGITYRDGNNVIRTNDRCFIHDLDALPFPDRLEYRRDAYIGIQTSRGCPGKCIFCSARGLSGGKYRMRSAENVISEVEMLIDKGINTIFFQDDTLTADIDRLNAILDLIERKELKFLWSAESRVDMIYRYPKIVKRMAGCGCKVIQFGIESGSQAVLNALKKNITIEQINKAVSIVAEEEITLMCSFLIGHPFDTYATMLETFELGKRLCDMGAVILLSVTCPYPGTIIQNNPKGYHVEIINYDYSNYSFSSPVMNTKYLTAKEIKKYHYNYSMALSDYYKKRRMLKQVSETSRVIEQQLRLDASQPMNAPKKANDIM